MSDAVPSLHALALVRAAALVRRRHAGDTDRVPLPPDCANEVRALIRQPVDAALDGVVYGSMRHIIEAFTLREWDANDAHALIYTLCAHSDQADVAWLARRLMQRLTWCPQPRYYSRIPSKQRLLTMVMSAVAVQGHTDVLKELVLTYDPPDDRDTVFYAACRACQLEAIQYLCTVDHELLSNNYGLLCACAAGGWNVVEWWMGVAPPPQHTMVAMYWELYKYGHGIFAEQLLRVYANNGRDVCHALDHGEALISMCKHVSPTGAPRLEQAVTHFFAIHAHDMRATAFDALYAACMSGCCATVKLFLDRLLAADLARWWKERQRATGFDLLRNGHHTVLQLLITTGRLPLQFSRGGSRELYAACKGGHTQTVAWIIAYLCDRGESVREPHRGMLSVALINGHLDLAQFIIANGFIAPRDCRCLAFVKPSQDDIVHRLQARNNSAFRMVCANGHLDAAQWMVAMSLTDVRACLNGAVCAAAVRGHVQVVSWLATHFGPGTSALSAIRRRMRRTRRMRDVDTFEIIISILEHA